MPRAAWVEIRDENGDLLASIPAKITGGAVTAALLTFPPGTRGAIQLVTDEAGEIHRDDPEVGELPTSSQILIVQMG